MALNNIKYLIEDEVTRLEGLIAANNEVIAEAQAQVDRYTGFNQEHQAAIEGLQAEFRTLVS